MEKDILTGLWMMQTFLNIIYSYLQSKKDIQPWAPKYLGVHARKRQPNSSWVTLDKSLTSLNLPFSTYKRGLILGEEVEQWCTWNSSTTNVSYLYLVNLSCWIVCFKGSFWKPTAFPSPSVQATWAASWLCTSQRWPNYRDPESAVTDRLLKDP